MRYTGFFSTSEVPSSDFPTPYSLLPRNPGRKYLKQLVSIKLSAIGLGQQLIA
ncbi:MAG: hypothetical protein F6K53_40560 [Moorea sp. SIO4A1]|uniref:hypothetical protein n=1 Tax=Moorena sp. SIO4A1 TaxID=2607835 RepID=UPI001450CA55|nr:hypothetical protein [Moorena sp. SIO4A1]NEQ63298.1 hypothetical protein [Moorena sp. SIO4A1]